MEAISKTTAQMGKTNRLAPWLLLLLAAVLFFANLDNQYLWQDEAETALLARRILNYGLPLAFDGRNMINQYPTRTELQFNADYIWIYHPWLPHYLTALSFFLFPPGTLSARLPVVLASLISVLIFYQSCRHHLGGDRLATIATVLLLSIVPLVIHLRQAKYFGWTVLFTILLVDAYLRLEKKERIALPLFILSALLLFHSNFGIFLPTVAVLGVWPFLVPSWQTIRRPVVLGLGLVAVLAGPWALFMAVGKRGAPFSIYRFLGHFVHYLAYIFGWVFPLVLVIVFVGLYFISLRRHPVGFTEEQMRLIHLFVAIVAANVLLLSYSFDWIYFRYVVQLVPLLVMLLALLVDKIIGVSRPLGYVLLVLLCYTSVLHTPPFALVTAANLRMTSWQDREDFAAVDKVILKAAQWRSDQAQYIYEITHDFDSPDEGIVKYLQTYALPTDKVLTNYGELVIAFYTDLTVGGGLSGYRAEELAVAPWIIPRQYGPYYGDLMHVVSVGPYEPIEIPYPDTLWGNGPAPEDHLYATAKGERNVVIYHRIGAPTQQEGER